MSHKRATAFILDVGPSMGDEDSQQASTLLFDLLIANARENKSKDEVSVFLTGCGTTNYRGMDENPGYVGINQFWPQTDHPMQNVSVELLQAVNLRQWKQSSHVSDILGACVWALDSLVQHCGKYKYKKSIRVITNTHCFIDKALLETVSNQAVSNEISVDILGFDFLDDHDQDVSPRQILLQSLSDTTGGNVFSGKEALCQNTLVVPLHQKPSRPFGATMISLGDQNDPSSLIQFPISVCLKSEIAKLPKLLQLSKPALELHKVAFPDWSDMNPNKLGAKLEPTTKTIDIPVLSMVQVAEQVGYCVTNTNNDDDVTDLAQVQMYVKDETTRAYKFGKSSVPLGAWDQQIDYHLNDKSNGRGFQILAFIPASSIDRQMYMSNVRYIVHDPKYEMADIRLSALVYVLQNRNLAAITRYNYSSRSNPCLTALFPHVTKQGDKGLLMCHLPTEYDVNQIQHMPLLFEEIAELFNNEPAAPDSEKPPPRLPEQFVPSIEQRMNMKLFVETLMLNDECDMDESTSDPHDDVSVHQLSSSGDQIRIRTELLKPSSIYHPLIQRIHAAVEEALFDMAHPAILPALDAIPEHENAKVPNFFSSVESKWMNPQVVPVLKQLERTHRTIQVQKHAQKHGVDGIKSSAPIQESKRPRIE